VVEVEAFGVSEQGPRPLNEDRIGWRVPDDPLLRQRKGALFVLADGLGGHESGEVASAIAVDTLIEEYYSPSSHGRVEPALQRAVQNANLKIYDLAQREARHRSMATTLVGLAVTDMSAYVAHVGDSRVYHWRAGVLTQLTTDHSEIAELVRLRLVRREKLREHPARNALTRTVGSQLLLRPDFLRQPVRPDDRFLLCSDGLWAEVDESEIAQVIATSAPADACRTLVERALAAGSEDNVSAQVVRIVALEEDAAEEARPRRWPAFLRGRAP